MTTLVKTKHKIDCKMAFGKKDETCPRCRELLNGAAPRKSWHAAVLQKETDFKLRLKNHDCKASNCGIVCTAFDW